MKQILPRAVLVLFLAVAILPLIAVGVFGFVNVRDGFTVEPLLELFRSDEVVEPLLNTVILTVLTVVVGYVLVIPTLLWMHLRTPRMLSVAETASLLPYIIPAIALVGGVNLVLRPSFPGFFVSVYSLVPFYVLMTLPFIFRTIDSGLRALDLKTLMRAAESLGCGPFRTFFTVVLPNLWPAIVSGSLLVVLMASSELVMAQLLLHKTFPTMLVELGQSQVRLAAALSFITIVGSWVLMAAMVFAGRGKNAAARATQFTI
ncbi:putative spermidine/putrescine transport system permease protein [Rhodococcus sp. LBL1]|nr:putative spermidine/putrescine transport system permease protein [Rhodococcus sp. LBL1]MDH6684228.1 putative spermidine/putrescine transport system permease protein [Rhodococcus sp. LBL2]